MNAIVTDRDGNIVPGANWGNADLSGINLKRFGPRDWDEQVTIAGGLTGPRYVQDGHGGVGDVLKRCSLSVPNTAVVGYCPMQAEFDERDKFIQEQIAQR